MNCERAMDEETIAEPIMMIRQPVNMPARLPYRSQSGPAQSLWKGSVLSIFAKAEDNGRGHLRASHLTDGVNRENYSGRNVQLPFERVKKKRYALIEGGTIPTLVEPILIRNHPIYCGHERTIVSVTARTHESGSSAYTHT